MPTFLEDQPDHVNFTKLTKVRTSFVLLFSVVGSVVSQILRVVLLCEQYLSLQGKQAPSNASPLRPTYRHAYVHVLALYMGCVCMYVSVPLLLCSKLHCMYVYIYAL